MKPSTPRPAPKRATPAPAPRRATPAPAPDRGPAPDASSIRATPGPAPGRSGGRTPDPSTWIAWVAVFTIPPIAFAERLAWYESRARFAAASFAGGGSVGAYQSAMEASRWILVGGMLFAGVTSMVVGPHVALLFALLLVLAGAAWMVVDPGTLALGLTAFGVGSANVGLLAAAGVSAGGGAPGLRYGMVVALYAAANAAGALAPWSAEAVSWGGPIAVGLALLALPAPLGTWWFAARRPRRPDEGATGRVALVGGGLFVVLVLVQAAFSLQEPLWASISAQWQAMINPLVVLVTANVALLALLVLQVAKMPARFGVTAGAGVLLLSLVAVAGWSMANPPALALLAAVGVAEVLIWPWALARATSDAHWRLTGLFAAVILLPPYLLSEPSTVFGVVAAMVLAVAAVPIAGVGWVADTWIFGDEPGPVERRRGHR